MKYILSYEQVNEALGNKNVNFVKELYPAAMRIEKKYGIPADFIVAHLAIESGWGSAVSGTYNYGGIKAKKKPDGTAAESATCVWTWEYAKTQDSGVFCGRDKTKDVFDSSSNSWKIRVKDLFKNYTSAEAFLEDYSKLLRTNRYLPAMANKTNSLEYGKNIIKLGYATNPHYGDTLASVIPKVMAYKPNAKDINKTPETNEFGFSNFLLDVTSTMQDIGKSAEQTLSDWDKKLKSYFK